MGGSAKIDSDVLVDSLVDMIDGLRGELHPQFGVRPYRVFTVLRTWSGDEPGEGSFSDLETELDPQPRVVWGGNQGDSRQLTKAGVYSPGGASVTEVSLTYTFAELYGTELPPNQEFLIKISEAHGQGSPDRYFRHAMPPTVDREKNMGWVLNLRGFVSPGCQP